MIKKEKNKVGARGDWALFFAVILLALIGTVFIYSASNYSANKTYGDSFYFVKIDGQEKLYKDNFAAIGWDDNHNTLRYVFICDAKEGNVYNIQTTYLRFYNLNWNDDENDYIFNY